MVWLGSNTKYCRVWLLLTALCISTTRAFVTVSSNVGIKHSLLWSSKGDEDDDIDISDKDWRAFRAKLVMSEDDKDNGATTDTEPTENDDTDLDGIGSLFGAVMGADTSTKPFLDPTQWAYDSGNVIEQGAVILGGVEQEFGFGLRQQYFHKAAILVLDHLESTFTKGIILNRPTDLTLEDDINKGVRWRVWFGGDVQGLSSSNPEIVCLHTMKNEMATKASIPVMNDIQRTTFDAAKKLVKAGVCNPTDFWVFAGYAGWGPGQLMGELERKSWYMVATDSQTLLQELARQASGADVRDAGLDTWEVLMNMIGREQTAKQYQNHFDDLMLKEWALQNLLSTKAGGGAGKRVQVLKPTLVDVLKSPFDKDSLRAGSIVRASPSERSPFLLESQELHRSTVLIIQDDDALTIGVILNLPGSKPLEMSVKDDKDSETLTVPLRHGGPFSVKGSEPLLWLHSHSLLKGAKVGSPVGNNNGIWKCTTDDVAKAIDGKLAKPNDFLVVAGVSIWIKGEKNSIQGMQGELDSGRFEIVPDTKAREVWDALTQQDVLSLETLEQNLDIAREAWLKGSAVPSKKAVDVKATPIAGLGEGFDEEDDSIVFKSDVKVSKLADEALRSWVATFLLGEPSLGKT